jgi:hypothetical protein
MTKRNVRGSAHCVARRMTQRTVPSMHGLRFNSTLQPTGTSARRCKKKPGPKQACHQTASPKNTSWTQTSPPSLVADIAWCYIKPHSIQRKAHNRSKQANEEHHCTSRATDKPQTMEQQEHLGNENVSNPTSCCIAVGNRL